MSSRSLAAARARRSAESAPPVSGNRPVTSIGSVAQHMPPPNYPTSSNVRTAKAMSRSPQQPQYQQPQYQQQQYQEPQQPSNGLPFSKISISDAIGLITLRLGRVEQWIIETDHEREDQQRDQNTGPQVAMDNSVVNALVNRIEAVEKASGNNASFPNLDELKQEISTLKEQFGRIADDVTKHTLELAKNTEQVFRFNRELTETKDILKSFMVKYDMFAQEVTQNFSDYELALGDLEKRLPQEQDLSHDEAEITREDDLGVGENGTSLTDLYTSDNNLILSSDLKSMIKQELSGL